MTQNTNESAAAQIFTCKGKGGEYELVGYSNGAGTSRGTTVVVYRDASNPSALYHRDADDFNDRMEWMGSHAPAIHDVELPPLPVVPDAIIRLLEGYRKMLGDDDSHKHVTMGEIVLQIRKAMRAAIAADRQRSDAGAPADPLDMPLPCDVVTGHVTLRAGVPLRTLVLRAQSLHRMLHDRLPTPTPEQRAAFDALVGQAVSTQQDQESKED